MKPLKEYRFKDNPLEKKFYDRISKVKDITLSRLSTGTIDGSTPKKFLNEEELELVKGTIQWLGTPVGIGFLREMGFTRDE